MVDVDPVWLDPECGQGIALDGEVAEDRIYLDDGLTGTNRARPGLDQTLAAVREGDTLVLTGNYRIAYEIEDDQLLVRILAVGHRREIYRGR